MSRFKKTSNLLESFGYFCCVLAMAMYTQTASAMLVEEETAVGLCTVNSTCKVGPTGGCSPLGRVCNSTELCTCADHETTGKCECRN